MTDNEYEEVSPTTSIAMGEAEMGSSEDITFARVSSPTWKIENGTKQFYDGYGALMYGENTKFVIDVSEHNGTINWEKVKAAGVDGVIIRVGWGYLGRDTQFKRNVSECNRLVIPYGVYLYSYAYNANFALSEAKGTIEMLKEADVNLSYPIYYDIEKFSNWNDNGTTRKPPTTVSEYEKIIATYITYMSENGYAGKVHVYSYRSYLNGVLNSPSIHAYTSWAAEYGAKLNFENNHYGGEQGWQYTSSGTVDGISGRVDLNCFSDQFYNTSLSQEIPDVLQQALIDVGGSAKSGYLYGIKLGTDLSALTTKLSETGDVSWLNSKGNGISGGNIATGQTLKITISENETIKTYTLTVVEKGDVDGDGRIRAVDYSLVKNDLLGIKKLSGAFAKAADIDGDGNIRAVDYSLIKNDILNIKKISQ